MHDVKGHVYAEGYGRALPRTWVLWDFCCLLAGVARVVLACTGVK